MKMVSFEINTEHTALQRHNTENSKQIFPEKELRGLSPNFHIHVSAIFIFPQSVCLLCCRSTSQFTVDNDCPLPRRAHSQILIQSVPKTLPVFYILGDNCPTRSGKDDLRDQDHFMYFIQHCLFCRLSDSTESKDAGIEP